MLYVKQNVNYLCSLVHVRILRRTDTKLLLLCLAVILSLGVWRWAAEDEADEPLLMTATLTHYTL